MARRLLTWSLWGLFLLMLAEALFRHVVFPEYVTLSQDVFERHPEFGHFNKPNLEIRRYNPQNYDVTVRTNSLGVRGPENQVAEGLRGLWFTGDSNTFSSGVEDDQTFVAQVESRHGLTTVNLASEGLEYQDVPLLVRHFADLGYRPEAVIVGVTLNKVLHEYAVFMDRLQDSGPAAATAPPPREPDPDLPRHRLDQAIAAAGLLVPRRPIEFRGRLITSSALYGWTKVGVMAVPALRDVTLDLGLRADIGLIPNGSIDFARPITAENPAAVWFEEMADFSAMFRDRIRHDHGVPFGVILFPTYHQLHPAEFERFVRHAGMDTEDLDPRRSLEALVRDLAERNVPTLNLLPVLAASGVDPLTFPDDAHLNAEALTVVADAVAAWVQRDLLANSAPR